MKLGILLVFALLNYCIYLTLLFSGDNAPPNSWVVAISAFFGKPFVLIFVIATLVVASFTWAVKRPPRAKKFLPIDFILIGPIVIWGILLISLTLHS